MLSGLAPRTICNCVFMVEKTQAKKRHLESTHHTFSVRQEVTCSQGWRGEGEAEGKETRAVRVTFH